MSHITITPVPGEHVPGAQFSRSEALGDTVRHHGPHARRQVWQRILKLEGTVWRSWLGSWGLGVDYHSGEQDVGAVR